MKYKPCRLCCVIYKLYYYYYYYIILYYINLCNYQRIMNTSEKTRSENGRSYELRYIMDQKTGNFDINYLDAKNRQQKMYTEKQKAARKLDSKKMVRKRYRKPTYQLKFQSIKQKIYKRK